MKITGLYFSGTGNTAWVAEKLKSSLIAKDHDVNMFSIEEIEAAELIDEFKKSDIIGFLYPGYGCDMPKVYDEYLSKLEGINLKINTRAFSIMTAAMYIADGAIITKPLCERIGAELVWGNVIIMPCNFDTPVPLFKIPNNDKIAKMKKRALIKIEKIVQRIEKNEKHYDGGDLFNVVTGKMHRGGWRGAMDKYGIHINESICTSCGICVRLCPANNLHIAEKGQPVKTNNNCSVCLRCINNCPNDAIRMFSTKTKSKYRQYKGPGE
ncbi:EFR1 family ferrodoxin [Vallitalea okinawensis]|uniref:EFR1 family ferrodoxin n=1 Tax=Vallitalea okinawensis TaxID=2078660 RepID=UPI000CFC6E63|nr:EFR1 family ferrodoxin [Vallitalea okinawensis]